MRRRAVFGMAFAATVSGLVSCGDSRSSVFKAGERSEGGEGGAGADSSAAGETTETGGSTDRGGGRSTGGRTGGTAGSRGGQAGKSQGGTSAASGGTTSGEGGDDGGAGGSEPEPTICARFGRYEGGKKALDIVFAFESATFYDCRLSWVMDLTPEERLAFSLKVQEMTLELWHCVEGAPSAFSLLDEPVPLSRAEARALIQDYLDASRDIAQMSPSELRYLDRELTELAEPLIDDSLSDFSRSRCDGGGAGGMGGTGVDGGVGGTIDGGEGGAAGVSDGGARAFFW